MALNTDTLYVLDTVLPGSSQADDTDRLAFLAALRQLVVADCSIAYCTLSERPDLFLKPEIMDLIGEDMLDVFPLVIRGEVILKRGAYPRKEELEAWFDLVLFPLDIEKEREIEALKKTDSEAFAICCDLSRYGGCAGCGDGCSEADWAETPSGEGEGR